VKILKKYDKRTGAGLLLLATATLQEKAFFKTETVPRMVRECEAMLEVAVPPTVQEGQYADREVLVVAERSTFRKPVVALLIMLRAVSSTRGTQSLPPLNLPDSDPLRSFHVIPIFQ
jgi:hypothetical protein